MLPKFVNNKLQPKGWCNIPLALAAYFATHGGFLIPRFFFHAFLLCLSWWCLLISYPLFIRICCLVCQSFFLCQSIHSFHLSSVGIRFLLYTLDSLYFNPSHSQEIAQNFMIYMLFYSKLVLMKSISQFMFASF